MWRNALLLNFSIDWVARSIETKITINYLSHISSSSSRLLSHLELLKRCFIFRVYWAMFSISPGKYANQHKLNPTGLDVLCWLLSLNLNSTRIDADSSNLLGAMVFNLLDWNHGFFFIVLYTNRNEPPEPSEILPFVSQSLLVQPALPCTEKWTRAAGFCLI